MLLLPIRRGTLYVAQSSAALGDVWILLMLPLVVVIPLGLARRRGARGAALAAIAAGVLLVVVVVAVSLHDDQRPAPRRPRPPARRAPGAALHAPGTGDRHAPESVARHARGRPVDRRSMGRRAGHRLAPRSSRRRAAHSPSIRPSSIRAATRDAAPTGFGPASRPVAALARQARRS